MAKAKMRIVNTHTLQIVCNLRLLLKMENVSGLQNMVTQDSIFHPLLIHLKHPQSLEASKMLPKRWVAGRLTIKLLRQN